MEKYFLVVAGGKGLRMGSDIPKQFIDLCGLPILMRTILKLSQSAPESRFILVLPQENIAMWNTLAQTKHFDVPVRIVTGGATRFLSVKNGLDAIGDADGLVAVHDGVRPFVAEEVVRQCFHIAEEHGAAIPVIRPVESVRIDNGEGENVPFDRDKCYLVQTPQTFRISILKEAYRQPYQPSFTDDASVVEAMGLRVALVNGNRENIKITTQYDLRIAETLIKR